MEKEICFCINGKNLYLEKVLVDYMDIPIFFLCENQNEYYIALCTDVERLNYVVAKISMVSTYALLHGMMSMRDAFLNQGEYWEILSGNEPSQDVVSQYPINHIDMGILPDADAYFAVLDTDSQPQSTVEYIKSFDEKYWKLAKPKRIVFLDVDGVLTYSTFSDDKTENIDVEKIIMLREICEKTDSKVVIISSWRGDNNWTPSMYRTLICLLRDNDIEIVGNAPSIPAELEHPVPNRLSLEDLKNVKVKHGTGRAAEVEKYIADHGITDFLILDDEDWDWAEYGLEKHWIRPTWFGNGGLKPEHIEQSIKIMNHKDYQKTRF